MEVEAEIIGQFAAFEDLIEQALVSGSKQNRMVGDVFVSDVGSEVQYKKGHGPVHAFEFLCSLLSDL